MNRRNFLKVAGASGVIVAAGVGGFAVTRTPHAALEPWDIAGQSPYTDPLRRAFSFAILAPNPHNRQPWVVDLESDREAVLYCDPERLLPETDPFDRQIVIGLGCFVELFSLAARNDGYRAEVALFPDGEPGEHIDARPIARLTLVRDELLQPDLLFKEVLRRRTNRNPYDLDREIPATALQAIVAVATAGVSAEAIGDDPRLAQLRTLTQQAFRGEIMDTEAFGESIDLMRIGRAEIEANPDGLFLSGAVLEALNTFGVITREKMADPESSAFQVGLDMADEQALTAMGFVWINTAENSRAEQIAAGRSYLRIALKVSALGMAMQPMSQALQEYEAMRTYYEQVNDLLGDGGNQTVQMLARLGYADTVHAAPRWRLETRLKQPA